jgi:hypothetical protein
MGIFNFFKKEEKENDWISKIPKNIAEIILQDIKTNPQACSVDEIPQGYGKFGLEKTNPIPVYGVPSNETYLTSLRTKNGERLRWRRVGSIEISNIVKPIDEYEIFNAEGNTIAFIYLSPYHWKTSKKAPEGFKII